MTAIETVDITTALNAAGIDHRVEAPGTTVESIHVVRADGRTVAFAPSTTETGDGVDGVDVAYYTAGVDSDVRTQDWVPSIGQLVADLLTFLR